MSELTNIITLFVLVSLLILVSSFLLGLSYSIPSGNVALIKIDGEILSLSTLLSSGVTSDELIDALKEADNNPNVLAIILSINSPGGMVVASKEVTSYVSSLDKPVVAWIREIGTSGAYLIASGCDYVIADPLSTTGSIGATSSYLEYSGTLDKYGVEYVRMVTGEFKDIGSEYRNLTESDRAILSNILNESFAYFLNFVSTNRNLTLSSINTISDGRIVSGSQAYILGLVDELGGYNSVKNYLSNITGLSVDELVIDDYSVSKGLSISDFFTLSSTLSLPTYS